MGAELTGIDSRLRRQGRRREWLELRQLALDAARAGGTREEQGQLAARSVRERLGLDGAPVESVADILVKSGVDLANSVTVADTERMLVVAQELGRACVTILATGRTKTTWGRRFEQARALGHLVLDPSRSGALGAASSTYAQEARRRRSGAFAAELLLPEAGLAAVSANHLDGASDASRFTTLLERYGVGARTAAHQLFNHGWLSSESAREDLIEAFASAG